MSHLSNGDAELRETQIMSSSAFAAEIVLLRGRCDIRSAQNRRDETMHLLFVVQQFGKINLDLKEIRVSVLKRDVCILCVNTRAQSAV